MSQNWKDEPTEEITYSPFLWLVIVVALILTGAIAWQVISFCFGG